MAYGVRGTEDSLDLCIIIIPIVYEYFKTLMVEIFAIQPHTPEGENQIRSRD